MSYYHNDYDEDNSSPSGSDWDHNDKVYDYGYDCDYDHDHQHADSYDNGPYFENSPQHGYDYSPQHAHGTSPQHGYDYSSQDRHYKEEPSQPYTLTRNHQSLGHGIVTQRGSDFLGEHHVVQGNSTRNGPYMHENYRVHHEDGSYHGHYLWDANRPAHGHHIHQGSYGMERNSRQDIHYDYDAEYNLDLPAIYHLGQGSSSRSNARGQSQSQQKTQSGSSRTQGSRARDVTYQTYDRRGRVLEHHGGPSYTPSDKDWLKDNWRSEYHYLRRNGMTVYKEDSRTDGRALARAWMEKGRQRDEASRRSRRYW